MIFLFDADCGFCTTTVAKLRILFPKVEFRASHTVALTKYNLTQEEVHEKAWLITSTNIYGGGAAVTGLLRSWGVPGRVVADVLSKEPVSKTIEAAYSLIARNRHRLPGATPDSCTM